MTKGIYTTCERNNIERYAPSSSQKDNRSIVRKKIDRLHLFHMLAICVDSQVCKKEREEDYTKTNKQTSNKSNLDGGGFSC